MKKLTTTILALGMLSAGLYQAAAAPTMRLSADGGVTWTNIVDNGPGDVDPTPGFVTYIGPVGGWTVSIASGFGSPLTGDPLNPTMDLGTQTQSADAQTLIVQMSDTGFIPFPNQTFIAMLTLNTTGTVTYNTYRDSNNVLFGTTAAYSGGPAGSSPSPTAATLMVEGPFSNTFNGGSNAVVVANGGVGPYSLTLETVIVHPGAARTQTDAFLETLPPPPCNCALTFNAPNLTICAGDTIPDATATQDCGSGPTPVLVTVTGAVTNGVCPQIITRTNSAVDGCGNPHTQVQTITINCAPICTITPSVTITIVGTSNLTASVANAGVGATYAWSVLNGTITAGQNSTKITWTAGTDTNSPITIVIKITSAAGCQSVCSASVKLNPKPPGVGLGSGDTATIGFWHNKNGQGLILGASNSPALGNWLAANYPCLFGTLAGQPNSVVASTYLGYFGVKGQKTYAQVMSGAFACYFTSSSLGGGTGPKGFGFNISPGGTGSKLFNVGSLGTTIGLQNNTSYTVSDILTAANAKCPWNSAVFDALNTIFDGINQTGDIN